MSTNYIKTTGFTGLITGRLQKQPVEEFRAVKASGTVRGRVHKQLQKTSITITGAVRNNPRKTTASVT